MRAMTDWNPVGGRVRNSATVLLLIGVLVLSACVPHVLAGDVFPRDRILFPNTPAAVVEGPAALRFNPAGLGFDQGFAVNYYHTYSDSSAQGDDGLYVSGKGLGFAVEWLGSGALPDGRSYTLAASTNSQRSLSFGSSYQWRSSDDPIQNKSHFWSHGVTWRPNSVLSLAAVADNYNRMKIAGARTEAEYVYSAALNLLDGRFIIGGDWYQTTSQRLRDGTYRVAAALEIGDGLTIFGDFDEHRNYFLGGRIDMANLFAGSHALFHRDDGYRGGVAYVGHSETRRRPAVRLRGELVRLHLDGDVPDRKPARTLFSNAPLTSFEWVSLLDKAAKDPLVDAVIMTIEQPRLGAARREEIRRAMMRVRKAGKFVLVYLDGVVGNGEYYLATAADCIVIPPVSSVHLLGLRAEVTFVKRLLDKIGIKADLEHVGDYKSASDLLTRTEMTTAHREALDALLDDLDRYWTGEMGAGRNICRERVREWIDHGPYVSVDALREGLVDEVAYEDELERLVEEAIGPLGRTVSQPEFLRREYKARQWGTPPAVAVVFASGTMNEGTDRDQGLWGPVMGSHTVSRALVRARSDQRVEAIVLRVNSGGGSIFASEEILREVMRTAGVKPIVVSFGDVAASGGYYIACGADSVFALPNTITGSIGVISGKFELSKLYDKIGFDKEVLTRGRYADLNGNTRSYDDQERAAVREQMMRAYDRFVQLVADGRRLSPDSVAAIAQGRVWSGLAAHAIGLVDRYADLDETINVAARMAGIKPGKSIQVMVLPRPGRRLMDLGWLGTVAGDWGGESLASRLAAVLDLAGVKEKNPRYELPYMITIR